MSAPSKRYETARAVIETKTAGTMEGALLDTLTASALVNLYEALSDNNKARFDTAPLMSLVRLAFGGSKK